MLTLTRAALERLRRLIQEHPEDPIVRIAVRDVNTQRLSLSITLETATRDDDGVEEIDGVTVALARIIHEGFYCNRRHAAATSRHAALRPASGRARPSRPQHTVSRRPRPLGAPRARLAWRLVGFVTNPRKYCGLDRASAHRANGMTVNYREPGGFSFAHPPGEELGLITPSSNEDP